MGGIWVGGVQDGDTLVSVGSQGYPYGYFGTEEFVPCDGEEGRMQYYSTVDSLNAEIEGAVSEQDFIVNYVDTVSGLHGDWFQYWLKTRPLNVKVTQRSYAWSYDYCQDIIFLEFTVENIGHRSIESGYFGLYNFAMCGLVADKAKTGSDMCGMLKTFPSFQGCDFEDTLQLAWYADASGDPLLGEFIDHVVWIGDTSFKWITGVVGYEFLDEPTHDVKTSYIWWANWSYPTGPSTYERGNFGPRCK